jgi:hypothetical protein
MLAEEFFPQMNFEAGFDPWKPGILPRLAIVGGTGTVPLD